MIDVKLLKNSARMSLRLNGTTEHVFGQTTKSEAKRIIADMREASKVCKDKLNPACDKFEKSASLKTNLNQS